MLFARPFDDSLEDEREFLEEEVKRVVCTFCIYSPAVSAYNENKIRTVCSPVQSGPIGAVGRALRLSKRGSRVQVPATSVG